MSKMISFVSDIIIRIEYFEQPIVYLYSPGLRKFLVGNPHSYCIFQQIKSVKSVDDIINGVINYFQDLSIKLDYHLVEKEVNSTICYLKETGFIVEGGD